MDEESAKEPNEGRKMIGDREQYGVGATVRRKRKQKQKAIHIFDWCGVRNWMTRSVLG